MLSLCKDEIKVVILLSCDDDAATSTIFFFVGVFGCHGNFIL